MSDRRFKTDSVGKLLLLVTPKVTWIEKRKTGSFPQAINTDISDIKEYEVSWLDSLKARYNFGVDSLKWLGSAPIHAMLNALLKVFLPYQENVISHKPASIV
ncbi:hypothetical protein ACFLU7_01170 [Chloroflexota bacterium]